MDSKIRKVDRLQIPYAGGMAREYDSRRFAGSKNAYLERARAAAMLRGVGRDRYGRSILDVGCGTGRGLDELQRAGFHNLRGVELSEEMIATARTKLGSAASLLRGSAFELPFTDATFDVVSSWNFVHMFRLDRQCVLVREMARVCRPNGRVVVELDSLHRGGCAVLLEQRRKRSSTKFTALWEISRLFPEELFSSVHVYGSAFPLLFRLFHRVPRVGLAVERIAFVPPFNWLASRVAVCAHRRRP